MRPLRGWRGRRMLCGEKTRADARVFASLWTLPKKIAPHTAYTICMVYIHNLLLPSFPFPLPLFPLSLSLSSLECRGMWLCDASMPRSCISSMFYTLTGNLLLSFSFFFFSSPPPLSSFCFCLVDCLLAYATDGPWWKLATKLSCAIEYDYGITFSSPWPPLCLASKIFQICREKLVMCVGVSHRYSH